MDAVAEVGDVHKWVRTKMALWGLWLLFQSVILTEKLVHLQAKSPWVDACMTWCLFHLSKLMCVSLYYNTKGILWTKQHGTITAWNKSWGRLFKGDLCCQLHFELPQKQ